MTKKFKLMSKQKRNNGNDAFVHPKKELEKPVPKGEYSWDL